MNYLPTAANNFSIIMRINIIIPPLIILLCVGCGQKGPLYLPEKENSVMEMNRQQQSDTRIEENHTMVEKMSEVKPE